MAKILGKVHPHYNSACEYLALYLLRLDKVRDASLVAHEAQLLILSTGTSSIDHADSILISQEDMGKASQALGLTFAQVLNAGLEAYNPSEGKEMLGFVVQDRRLYRVEQSSDAYFQNVQVSCSFLFQRGV